MAEPEASPARTTVDDADESEPLRRSQALSLEEVLRRRSGWLKRLVRCYSRHYWALIEDVRVKHRDYYWEHGISPFEDEGEEEEEEELVEEEWAGRAVADALQASKENGRLRGAVGLGLGEGKTNGGRKGERKRCAFAGCKSKAMPLTRFCYPHILSDKKQTLYKACTHVTRSCGQSGTVICGKPVLRAAGPSLCHVHFQKSQRNILQALRKAGLNTSFANRPTPKFSSLVTEYVHQIQAKRREALNVIVDFD